MKNVLVVFVLFLAGAVHGAIIYKWVDEKGVTHYSETPSSKHEAQEEHIQSNSPSESVGAPVKTWQEQEMEFQQRRVEREETQRKQEEQEAAVKRFKKARCLPARRNLDVLERQTPAYRINEKVERLYLDDDKRPAEIARLKKEVETYCPLPR